MFSSQFENVVKHTPRNEHGHIVCAGKRQEKIMVVDQEVLGARDEAEACFRETSWRTPDVVDGVYYPPASTQNTPIIWHAVYSLR
jgi:hypothetical protein